MKAQRVQQILKLQRGWIKASHVHGRSCDASSQESDLSRTDDHALHITVDRHDDGVTSVSRG